MTQNLNAALSAPLAGPAEVRASTPSGAPQVSELYVQRDRFIAVPRNALNKALAAPELWPGFNPADVRTCFDFMGQWRHVSYAEREQHLIEHYLPFNPDRDTTDNAIHPDAYDGAAKAAFLAAVREMLERANYDEIPRAKLDAVIDEYDPYGLELEADLGEYQDILVSIRGEHLEDVKPDFLGKVRRKKAAKVTVFTRVFLLFTLKPMEARVKEVMIAEGCSESKARKHVIKQRKVMPPDIDEQHIYIKAFKNVPRPDMEIMFPNTHIRLRRADKITIGASAGGGIGMGMLGLVTKLVAAALTPVGAILAIIGLAGAASQQVAQVVSRRNRYMLKVTRNLYFQNISNNQGALALLTERAEEEDIKEELLLYALLAKTSIHRSELAEAGDAIESFLTEHFKVHATFDTQDALERLLQSGLVIEQPDGTLLALSPVTATEHIRGLWHGYLDNIGAKQHESPSEPVQAGKPAANGLPVVP